MGDWPGGFSGVLSGGSGSGLDSGPRCVNRLQIAFDLEELRDYEPVVL